MMITTKKGNQTLSLDEFVDAIRALVPTADYGCLKYEYKRISRVYRIQRDGISMAPWKVATQALKRAIKEDARHGYSVILIMLAYDCGPLDFCPQDCPFETLLVRVSDGKAIIPTLY